MKTKLDQLVKIFWDNMLVSFPQNTPYNELNPTSLTTLKESIQEVLDNNQKIEEKIAMEQWEEQSNDRSQWSLNKKVENDR